MGNSAYGCVPFLLSIFPVKLGVPEGEGYCNIVFGTSPLDAYVMECISIIYGMGMSPFGVCEVLVIH